MLEVLIFEAFCDYLYKVFARAESSARDSQQD